MAVLPIARQEIDQLFAEAGRLGDASLVFLSTAGDIIAQWPKTPCAAHHPELDLAGCVRSLAPMALALTPDNPTLTWVCSHNVEFATSALFIQSVLVGSVVGYGDTAGRQLPLTRLLRLHLQGLLDLQQEMENLSREIARNYEELNLHYELAAKLGTHPSPGPVYHNIVEQIRTLIPCDHIAILIKDQAGRLTAAYAASRRGDPVPAFTLGPGEGISGEVVETGSAKIICRVDQHPRFIALPYPVTSLLSVPMITSGKVLGVINLSDKEGGGEFSTNDLKLLETIARQAAIALENARLFAEVRELFLSTVKSLASAIDAKDPYTHGHSLRVAYYSAIIADQLQLPAEQREEVYLAAVLHDVGKIAVPESILLKPDSLDEQEWEEMRQHPLHSSEILSKVKQFESIARAVRHEHERYDGTGYPDGLTAEQIPLASRIIAIADAYDAMTTSRSYRQGMAPEQAMHLLVKSAGNQFDPKIFTQFQTAFAQGRLTLPPDIPTQLMME
ncbi:MAG: HD domain-containing phosphohydrolase [Nitrospirota bacterium]